jgi:hypothetical protein
VKYKRVDVKENHTKISIPNDPNNPSDLNEPNNPSDLNNPNNPSDLNNPSEPNKLLTIELIFLFNFIITHLQYILVNVLSINKFIPIYRNNTYI